MGPQIQSVDARVAPEELLREMWEYYKAVYAEELPGDPVSPFRRQALDWRNFRADHARDRWLMRDQHDGIVAVGASFRDLAQNLENASFWIHVREDMRGNGLGKQLATHILQVCEADGRRRIDTNTVDGAAAEVWLERLGLQKAIQEKRSRLVVADVDRDMMRSWISRTRERADGYHLVHFRAPFPDEIVEKYCELQFQMNTAPLDDFEEEEVVFTPEMWRDQEQKINQAEADLDSFIAVHTATGDFVGSTSIESDRLWPEQAWQWETVVHPDHRNLGLGRSLKASMFEELMTWELPVERIDTYNASSNGHMLNINIAMSFKPILIKNIWQGDLTKALEMLGL